MRQLIVLIALVAFIASISIVASVSSATSVDIKSRRQTPAARDISTSSAVASSSSYSSSSPLLVDVTSYGAVGDGVTDDTAAVSAANQYLLQTISSSGSNASGQLYFAAGRYLLNSIPQTGCTSRYNQPAFICLTTNSEQNSDAQITLEVFGAGLSQTTILWNSSLGTLIYGDALSSNPTSGDYGSLTIGMHDLSVTATELESSITASMVESMYVVGWNVERVTFEAQTASVVLFSALNIPSSTLYLDQVTSSLTAVFFDYQSMPLSASSAAPSSSASLPSITITNSFISATPNMAIGSGIFIGENVILQIENTTFTNLPNGVVTKSVTNSTSASNNTNSYVTVTNCTFVNVNPAVSVCDNSSVSVMSSSFTEGGVWSGVVPLPIFPSLTVTNSVFSNPGTVEFCVQVVYGTASLFGNTFQGAQTGFYFSVWDKPSPWSIPNSPQFYVENNSFVEQIMDAAYGEGENIVVQGNMCQGEYSQMTMTCLKPPCTIVENQGCGL